MDDQAVRFSWPLATAELARWRDAGLKPKMFLRDDDAVSRTAALERLIGLCRRHGTPLLLAAIPARADESLGKAVRDAGFITGAVHGYAHISHAPLGTKPSELGIDRPASVVLEELRQGGAKLHSLFGRISGLLVPPWNRIDPQIAARVGEAGFAGISAHGWPDEDAAVASVNAHVDLVHWSDGATGRPPGWLDEQIAENLAIARHRRRPAIGILAHHLAHDAAAWHGLESILVRFAAPEIAWLAADELLAAPTQA